MAFRETGHANTKASGVRMNTRLVKTLDEADQVGRVLKRVLRFVVGEPPGRIAAERENVGDAGLRVTRQDGFDLGLVMADARQMRDRLDLCGVLNPLDQIMRQVASRSARSIRNADEVRHVILEIPDCLIKRFRRLWRFGRKELERERRRILLYDVGNVHRCESVTLTADQDLTTNQPQLIGMSKMAFVLPVHLQSAGRPGWQPFRRITVAAVYDRPIFGAKFSLSSAVIDRPYRAKSRHDREHPRWEP